MCGFLPETWNDEVQSEIAVQPGAREYVIKSKYRHRFLICLINRIHYALKLPPF